MEIESRILWFNIPRCFGSRLLVVQYLYCLKSLESARLLHMDCSIEDISIDEIVHVVLRDQKQETIQVLVNKLADAGIKTCSDLFKVSVHALERNLPQEYVSAWTRRVM